MTIINKQELVKLNDVRLSFPSLFKVKVWKDSSKEPRYEATFILDKEIHKKEIETINNQIDLICAEKKFIRKNINLCFSDQNLKDREEYRDKYVLKCTSKSRFPIVGKDGKTPVYEEDNLFYGGCYVSAYITLFPFDKLGTGIASNVKSIQFRKDGDPFSGDRPQNIEGAFDPIDDTNDLF